MILAPHKIVIFPYVRGGYPLARLSPAVRAQHSDQLGRQRHRLAAAFLDLAGHQAAAAALRALRRVPGASRLAQLRSAGGDAHVPPP